MKKYQIGGSTQSRTSDELNPNKMKSKVAPNPSFVPSGSMDRAQQGVETIKGTRPGMGIFKTTKKRTTAGGLLEPFEYKTQSIDTTGYSKGINNYKLKTVEGDGDKTGFRVTSSKSKIISKKDVPTTLKKLQMKKGTYKKTK